MVDVPTETVPVVEVPNASIPLPPVATMFAVFSTVIVFAEAALMFARIPTPLDVIAAELLMLIAPVAPAPLISMPFEVALDVAVIAVPLEFSVMVCAPWLMAMPGFVLVVVIEPPLHVTVEVAVAAPAVA